jgi:non-ribosomal peptide synthase protein (TIGR01720 family)
VRERVERLSLAQRTALAAQLRAHGDGGPEATKQLIAYVVPARGSTIDPAELTAHLRERVPAHLVPAAIVTLDAFPRLPNGKIDARSLPEPARDAPTGGDALIEPRDVREQTLARVWTEVLGIERVGVQDNFFELGGDSILSIQVVARARRAGLRLTPDQVFEYQTLGALAAAAITIGADIVRPLVESAPITPIQAWFFAQQLSSPYHWHQAIWLEPCPPFDRRRFEAAMRRVCARHDALRLALRGGGSELTLHRVDGDAQPVVLDIDLADCPDAQFERAFDRVVHDACNATDLARGPLIRAAIVRRDERPAERILVCVHHLAVDAISWGVLLEDLAAAYLEPDAPGLAQTSSFLGWADAISRAAAAGRFDGDAAYWLSRTAPAPLPRELDGPFTEARAEIVAASLTGEETRSLLHDVHAQWNTQVEDVLIAALARVLSRWTGAGRVRIGLERHGREALVEGWDLTRCIGWFTSYFPVVLDVDPAREPGEDLRDVKERLRALPRRGASFGILRYLRDSAAAMPMQRVPEPELVFNYAGRTDSWMQRVAAGTGIARGDIATDAPWRPIGLPFSSRAPENERRHRIEVNTFIHEGVLRVRWSYSADQYARATAVRLTHEYLDELRTLIAHALATETGGFTPADFPEAALRQDELDRLMRELGS